MGDPALPERSAAGRFLTRGQPSAAGVVASMLRTRPPHAILFVGPPSVGKTTLALDLAAGLLCMADDPASRPCRACRGCRLVAAGNHPDLHRLAPEGAGRQILIGDARRPDPGTVRHLAGELALLSVEGGARVALVEEAQRMNEDAQNALLKTLEEPPPGTTIVLCADDEDRLLPTVRSRCARIRLGPVGPRDIEALLEERGVAEAPTAARLARIAAGRPGLALAYALAPDAVAAREEIARTLVDLLDAGRAARLTAIREALGRAAELAGSLARATTAPSVEAAVVSRSRVRGRSAPQRGLGRTLEPTGGQAPGAAPSGSDPVSPSGAEAPEPAISDAGAGTGRATASERRRAALALLDIWRDVARDVLVVARGGRTRVRDAGLLDELEVAARDVDGRAGGAFLARLERTSRIVDGNANPELALDVLVLAWSRARLAG